VLKCPDALGKTFIEKTRTLDISRTGAKTLTEHPVNNGARLQMAVPHRKRTSWATVARVGRKTGNLQELGIAIDDTTDLWGVPLPDGTGTVPRQAGTEPQAGKPAKATDSSLALAQELLASTKLRPGPPAAPAEEENETADPRAQMLPEQVRSQIEQSLEEATQHLNEQAAEIKKNLREFITRQIEDYLRQCVEAAVRQVEAAAQDVTTRSQTAWEQRIQALTSSAQEQLKARLAEHETTLAASAGKVRRELARKLAEAVGEE